MKLKLVTTPEVSDKLQLPAMIADLKEPVVLEIQDIKDDRLHVMFTFDNMAEIDASITKVKEFDDTLLGHQVLKKLKAEIFN